MEDCPRPIREPAPPIVARFRALGGGTGSRIGRGPLHKGVKDDSGSNHRSRSRPRHSRSRHRPHPRQAGLQPEEAQGPRGASGARRQHRRHRHDRAADRLAARRGRVLRPAVGRMSPRGRDDRRREEGPGHAQPRRLRGHGRREPPSPGARPRRPGPQLEGDGRGAQPDHPQGDRRESESETGRDGERTPSTAGAPGGGAATLRRSLPVPRCGASAARALEDERSGRRMRVRAGQAQEGEGGSVRLALRRAPGEWSRCRSSTTRRP